MEHRLTQPNTPKTNGMVERATGIIKKETILKENYTNKEAVNEAMMAFLVYYLPYRRYGGVRKEVAVKTPFLAVGRWFMLKPAIFKQNPCIFKNKSLCSQPNKSHSFHKHPYET